MKIEYLILLLLASVSYGCAKWEEMNETTLVCNVQDITTGTMTTKAHVALIEVETPSRPFSPILRTTIEEFEVDYGESFSYSFNAKRGDRFEYFLEYQYPNFYFGDYGTSNGFYYEEQDMVELIKGSSNEYQLSVVPLAGVSLNIRNDGLNASPEDSIWMDLHDGNYQIAKAYKGVGKSHITRVTIPHGKYILTSELYRSGELSETESHPVYIRHAQDTTINVGF